MSGLIGAIRGYFRISRPEAQQWLHMAMRQEMEFENSRA